MFLVGPRTAREFAQARVNKTPLRNYNGDTRSAPRGIIRTTQRRAQIRGEFPVAKAGGPSSRNSPVGTTAHPAVGGRRIARSGCAQVTFTHTRMRKYEVLRET